MGGILAIQTWDINTLIEQSERGKKVHLKRSKKPNSLVRHLNQGSTDFRPKLLTTEPLLMWLWL